MVKRRQKHRKEQTATADAALPSYRKQSVKESWRNFLLRSKTRSTESQGQLLSPDSELCRCSSGPVSATDACSCTRCRDCAGWGHVATASYIQKPAHTHKHKHTQWKSWSNKGKTSLIIRRQSIRQMRKHTSYPVVESRRPVRSSGEVVDSIVASVAWIQEQSHVLDVVLDGWLHPLCWVGHDYKENISQLHFNCEGIVKGRGEGRIPTCYSGSDVGNIQIPFGIAAKIQVRRMNLKDKKNIKK